MSVVQTFVNRLGDVARKVEAEEGFNAQFILAQIALETGWLESVTFDQSTEIIPIIYSISKEAIMAKVCELLRQNITLWIKVLLKQALPPFNNALTRSKGAIEIISIGEYKNGKLKLGLWIILKIS